MSICSVPSDLAVNRSSNIFQFDVEGELFYFMHENIETIRSWIEALQYEPTTTIARAVLPSPLLKFFTINDIMTSNKEETTIDKPDSKLHASLAQGSSNMYIWIHQLHQQFTILKLILCLVDLLRVINNFSSSFFSGFHLH